MLGDVADIRARLRAVLPSRWFGDHSPNLDTILTCLATPWAWLYSLIQYTRSQTRFKSATGQWLDLISLDFFGQSLRRRDGEADDTFRKRILFAVIQEAATRSAISSNLDYLTGSLPQIFEPTNSGDTGAYGAGSNSLETCSFGLAYGVVGGWGNLQLPYQFFVNVRRPLIQGISWLAGYGTGSGGYGTGMIAYVDLALLGGTVSNEDIEISLVRSIPVTTTAWLRVS
jgi:hypothetical protein